MNPPGAATVPAVSRRRCAPPVPRPGRDPDTARLVVGLSGPPGVGKDHLGRLMATDPRITSRFRRVRIVSTSDLVVQDARELIEVARSGQRSLTAWLADHPITFGDGRTIVEIVSTVNRLMLEARGTPDWRTPDPAAKTPAGRHLLQVWGMAARRRHPDWWVRRGSPQWTPAPGELVIHTSIRDPAEAAWVWARHGLLVRLTAPPGVLEARGATGADHHVEHLLDDWDRWDLILDTHQHPDPVGAVAELIGNRLGDLIGALYDGTLDVPGTRFRATGGPGDVTGQPQDRRAGTTSGG